MVGTLIKGVSARGVGCSAAFTALKKLYYRITDGTCFSCGLNILGGEYGLKYCKCEAHECLFGFARSLSQAVTTNVATGAGIRAAASLVKAALFDLGMIIKGLTHATKSLLFLVGDIAEAVVGYLLDQAHVSKTVNKECSIATGLFLYVVVGAFVGGGPIGALVGASVYALSKAIQSLVDCLFS